MKITYLKQAWLVLALSLAFGGALAGVHVALSDRIATNKRNETFQQIPVLVGLAGPEAVGKLQITDPTEKTDVPVYQITDADGQAVGSFGVHTTEEGKVAYEVFDSAGVAVGWVIKGVGQGFADKIELLVGLDATADRLTGVFVLDQKETPGLGDNIRSREFTTRFEDKPVDTGVVIVKAGKGSGPDGQPGPREVESWSGATVSSLAVSGIVNAAVADFRNWLSQREQDS